MMVEKLSYLHPVFWGEVPSDVARHRAHITRTSDIIKRERRKIQWAAMAVPRSIHRPLVALLWPL